MRRVPGIQPPTRPAAAQRFSCRAPSRSGPAMRCRSCERGSARVSRFLRSAIASQLSSLRFSAAAALLQAFAKLESKLLDLLQHLLPVSKGLSCAAPRMCAILFFFYQAAAASEETTALARRWPHTQIRDLKTQAFQKRAWAGSLAFNCLTVLVLATRIFTCTARESRPP